MSYWTNKKVNKTKNCILNAKARNVKFDSSKENIFGPARSVANKDDALSHYLFMDRTFLGGSYLDKLRKRLRGGQYETETYYDCQPCSYKDHVGDSQYSCHNATEPLPAQQARISDISGDIENAKEFRDALKLMALNSNALYRTFRQAYGKNQKLKHISHETTDERYTLRHYGGEKNCKHIGGETERYIDVNPFNVVNVDLPTNNEIVCDKCNLKETMSKSTQHNSDQQHSVSKLSQEASGVTKSNITQQLNDSFKDLNFCEKCAILRGELPFYKNIKAETPINSKRNVSDSSCQTCCEPIQSCNKPIKITQGNVSELPIFITVPLNVQIDAGGGQAHILDSDIIIETSVDRNELKHYVDAPTAQAVFEPANSNEFYSCTSSSIGPGDNENSINVPNVARTVANSDVSGPVIPRSKETAGNEISINVPTPISKIENNDDFYPSLPKSKGTEVKQSSVQNPSTTRSEPKKELEVDLEKDQMNKHLINLELLKMKTERLRAELVQEIKTTLQHNPPQTAIQELNLATAIRGKNDIDTDFVKFTLTNGDQARIMDQEPKPQISLNIFNSATQTGVDENNKISLDVQNNISAMHANSRYKRNELRARIQRQLKELLAPYMFDLPEAYDTEERNAILLDFQKIFHPEVSNMLAEELRIAEAEQGIRYILEPEQAQNSADESLRLSESAMDLLEDIRHILNLKPRRRAKSKYKKYHREAKETILEGLHTILRARRGQTSEIDKEIRDIVLYDLNVMLKTCQAKTLPTQELKQEPKQELKKEPKQELKQEPKQEPKQESKQEPKQEPKQESKQEPKQDLNKETYIEIREGLLADLRLMLDATNDAVREHSGPSTSRSPEVQQRTTPRQINEIRDGLLAELRRMLDASPQLRAVNTESQEYETKDKMKPTFTNISTIGPLRDNTKRY